ncbi:MAG: hypothetical protein R3A78_10470 [Polyangiales bacterium]|nr:hypothetical protein [Myxococcales bacterium]
MPLPVLVSLAFAVGSAAAACAEAELRISPRPALLTQGAMAFLIFDALVVVPVATYFYAFHGDWFLLYLVDARRIPSALALLALVLVGGCGAVGFAAGATLVRAHKLGLAIAVSVLAVVASAAVVVFARDRLGAVGSYAQYAGHFGLKPFAEGSLLQGALVMGPLFVAAALLLCVRIYVGGRR